MLTVKPKYCFRPNYPSISKGFGLFQQLHYNLSLHFTLGLQSASYTDWNTSRQSVGLRLKERKGTSFKYLVVLALEH